MIKLFVSLCAAIGLLGCSANSGKLDATKLQQTSYAGVWIGSILLSKTKQTFGDIQVVIENDDGTHWSGKIDSPHSLSECGRNFTIAGSHANDWVLLTGENNTQIIVSFKGFKNIRSIAGTWSIESGPCAGNQGGFTFRR